MSRVDVVVSCRHKQISSRQMGNADSSYLDIQDFETILAELERVEKRPRSVLSLADVVTLSAVFSGRIRVELGAH